MCVCVFVLVFVCVCICVCVVCTGVFMCVFMCGLVCACVLGRGEDPPVRGRSLHGISPRSFPPSFLPPCPPSFLPPFLPSLCLSVWVCMVCVCAELCDIPRTEAKTVVQEKSLGISSPESPESPQPPSSYTSALHITATHTTPTLLCGRCELAHDHGQPSHHRRKHRHLILLRVETAL